MTFAGWSIIGYLISKQIIVLMDNGIVYTRIGYKKYHKMGIVCLASSPYLCGEI
jgi:hypothetical protein